MTNRRTLFAIACLGMLSFGIVLTTLGAVLPSVIERFGIDPDTELRDQTGRPFRLVEGEPLRRLFV